MNKKLYRIEKDYISRFSSKLSLLQQTLGFANSADPSIFPVGSVYSMLEAIDLNIKDEDQENRDVSQSTLFEILVSNKRFVIAGEPGSGKTSTLLFLASCLVLNYGQKMGSTSNKSATNNLHFPIPDSVFDKAYIPVFVSLKQATNFLFHSNGDFHKYILEEALKWEQEKPAQELLDSWLLEGRLWFLIDGLDEVNLPDRVRAIELLSDLANVTQTSPLLVSSRIAGEFYTQIIKQKPEENWKLSLFMLNSLGKKSERIEFTRKWLTANKVDEAEKKATTILNFLEKGSLNRMARNPLMLYMFIDLFLDNGCKLDGLPQNRSAAYEQYFSQNVWTRSNQDQIQNIRLDDTFNYLEIISWYTFRQNSDLDLFSIQEILNPWLVGENLNTWLTFVSHKMRLLYSYSDQSLKRGVSFAFAHKTFLEFFFARKLAKLWISNKDSRRWIWDNIVKSRISSPDWIEVFLFFGLIIAGGSDKTSISNGEEFIKLVLNESDHENKTRAQFIASLLEEGVYCTDHLANELFPYLFVHEAIGLSGRYFITKLLGMARSTEKKERVRTGFYLGQIGGELSINALSEMLNDDAQEVRVQACKSLGDIADPRCIDLLIPVLHGKDEFVGAWACSALGKTRDTKAIAALTEILLDKKSQLREGALNALGEIGGQAILQPLLIAVNDADLSVRHSTINLLSKWIISRNLMPDLGSGLSLSSRPTRQPARAIYKCFLEATRVREVSTRISALQGLSEFDKEYALKPLLDALSDDTIDVRREAVRLLNRIAATEGVQHLSTMLNEHGPDGIQWKLELLSMFNDQKAFDLITRFISHDDNQVRLKAISIVLNRKVKVDASNLVDHLRDQNPYIRLGVVSILGNLKGGTTVDNLISIALNDENEAVRMDAIRALDKHDQSENITSLLHNLLFDPSRGIRRTAIRVLADKPNLERLDDYTKLLKDEDPIVRIEAYRTLSILNSRPNPSILYSLAKNSAPGVRRRAIEILGETGNDDVIEHLISFTSDHNEPIQEESIEALIKIGSREAMHRLIQLSVARGNDFAKNVVHKADILDKETHYFLALSREKKSLRKRYIKTILNQDTKAAAILNAFLDSMAENSDEWGRKYLEVTPKYLKFLILPEPILPKTTKDKANEILRRIRFFMREFSISFILAFVIFVVELVSNLFSQSLIERHLPGFIDVFIDKPLLIPILVFVLASIVQVLLGSKKP